MSHVQLITCIRACIAWTLKCEIMDLSTQIMRTTVTGSRKPHCRVGLKKTWGTKREDKKGKEKEKEKEKSLGGIGSFDPIPFYS